MTTAPTISPSVASELADALPTRVRRRAERFLEDPPWQQEGREYRFENATVRVNSDRVVAVSDLECSCLIAPRCAHLAAVALSLPLMETAPETPATPPDVQAAKKPEAGISPEALTIVEESRVHLQDVLVHGYAHMSIIQRAALLSALHRLRSSGMVTAERQLTTVLQSTGGHRSATLGQLLLTLHRLQRGDMEAIGTARRAYEPVGSLKLQPLYAEPVITDSGFSGASVTFISEARTWHLSRVMPGESVEKHYQTTASWGGSSASAFELSRHDVLISGATASADGRLGSGKSVRVVVGKPAQLWQQVPAGYESLEGEVSQDKPRTITVAGQTLSLSSSALRRGAGPGLDLLAHSQAQVQVLVRDGQLLGLRCLDNTIGMPDELQGVWWPGLDEVTRNWVGSVVDVVDPDVGDPHEWLVPVVDVRTTMDRWMLRCVDAGLAGLPPDRMAEDERWLRRAGAPFAADLLARLSAARAAGSHRFDGTWQPNPAAVADAFLALAAY